MKITRREFIKRFLAMGGSLLISPAPLYALQKKDRPWRPGYEMLENEGAALALAENGRQAPDCLKNSDPVQFDIVIMDVQMPEMDGYEATRHIHSITPDLLVIGLTEHAMEEERERCLAAGMVAYLTKPVDINDLVDILLQQLPISDKRERCARPGTTTPPGRRGSKLRLRRAR